MLSCFIYRNSFDIFLAARIIGGCGSGIIFILVPVYMKELMGHQINPQIVDILITQFGCGIFIQYFIGKRGLCTFNYLLCF